MIDSDGYVDFVCFLTDLEWMSVEVKMNSLVCRGIDTSKLDVYGNGNYNEGLQKWYYCSNFQNQDTPIKILKAVESILYIFQDTFLF